MIFLFSKIFELIIKKNYLNVLYWGDSLELKKIFMYLIILMIVFVNKVFGKIRKIDIPVLDPVQSPYFEHLVELKSNSFPTTSLTSTNDTTLSADRGLNAEDCNGFGKIGPDAIGLLNNSKNIVPSADQSPHRLSVGLLTFTVFVQYMDFNGFSRAMESLRGQKLVYAPGLGSETEPSTDQKLYFAADIKVRSRLLLLLLFLY